MARYVGGAKTTGAGSTTLPLISLYAVALTGARVREVGAFNTTATAVDIKLCRLSTAGTQGSAITEASYDLAQYAASACQMFQTHSGSAPTSTDLGYRASLGASIGSGVIWTFGENGITIPVGTGNGIGIIIENGTGQILQAYAVWDE
jgi:hypothetical protein